MIINGKTIYIYTHSYLYNFIYVYTHTCIILFLALLYSVHVYIGKDFKILMFTHKSFKSKHRLIIKENNDIKNVLPIDYILWKISNRCRSWKNSIVHKLTPSTLVLMFMICYICFLSLIFLTVQSEGEL